MKIITASMQKNALIAHVAMATLRKPLSMQKKLRVRPCHLLLSTLALMTASEVSDNNSFDWRVNASGLYVFGKLKRRRDLA